MSLAALHSLPAHPPGVYRFISRVRPGPILATITDFGWHAGYIEGGLVTDKQTFLFAAGQAFEFPTYYGRNWDAFEEMVNDLSWLGLRAAGREELFQNSTGSAGSLLLYDHVHRFAATQPEEWSTALAILQSAAKGWQRDGIPFYVLLRHNRFWNRQVPSLVAQVMERRR
jgi:Barstar (barnase inhibitor)